MIALIDNYDSFTYNLVQALRGLGAQVRVFSHDAIDLAGLRRVSPRALVVSPGPGRPEDAGVSMAAIDWFHGRVPVLGVCLGHQALCQLLGARVVHARALMHGRTSSIRHDGSGLFQGLPSPLEAARYHSLAVDPASLPEQLRPCAWSPDGEVMAVRHVAQPTFGLQFHPESFMTPRGTGLLSAFVERARSAARPLEQVHG